MGPREEILALARHHARPTKGCAGQDDLLGVFGLAGDDATEFLEAYSAQFGVDLSEMRWEFHFIADEPPGHRRVLPIGTDGGIIPWQPITLDDLVRAAETGRWAWDYPDHKLRYSLRSLFAPSLAALALFMGMVAVMWR